MDIKEIKKKIKEKNIDRRVLAKKIGISPAHLSAMLNGWSSMKENYSKAIEKELMETTK